MGRENDLTFIKPLLKFAAIIGIFTKFGELPPKPNSCEKFKLTSMFVFVTSFFVWAANFKLKVIENRLELYTDLAASVILAFFTVYTILEFGILKRENYERFKKELERIDVILNTKLSEENEYSFYYETAGSYLFMLSLILTALFTEIYDAETLFHLFYKFYNNTFMVTLALVLRNYAVCLKFRFRKINDLFRKTEVDRYIETYLDLLETTKEFNKLFEWQLFILALRNLTWTLSIAQIFIYRIKMKNLVIGEVILNCIRGSLGWIMLFLVSISCGQLSKEANKIKRMRIAHFKGCDLRKIIILNRLLLVENIEINAGGFLVIDKNGLFSLTGVIAAYVIVLIQFNKLEMFKT